MRRLWLLLAVAIFFGARALLHQEKGIVIDSTTPVIAHPAAAVPTRLAPRVEAPASRFVCDGRTRCSQMSSCEEAKFFIAHCPNTQMDGDHDGIPCEQQYCG